LQGTVVEHLVRVAGGRSDFLRPPEAGDYEADVVLLDPPSGTVVLRMSGGDVAADQLTFTTEHRGPALHGYVNSVTDEHSRTVVTFMRNGVVGLRRPVALEKAS
jgi:hypothetical protein